MPVYDSIGRSYDETRKADALILRRILAYLDLPRGARVLDVGCGSGNYTIALDDAGFAIEGVDISETMLAWARKKRPSLTWHQGDARKLTFASESFDGVVSVLATHHMDDLDAALREMARVVKHGGPLVLFTSTPAQMRAFWLNHYLPSVVQISEHAMTEYDVLEKKLVAAGFTGVKKELFFVTNELEDWFLQCGKYRPEVYLDPVVRASISTFALHKDPEALARGLAALEADIKSEKVKDVIANYENDGGDFMWVAARRA
jgi:ubiquinone/menaquinone biosynthesis C-methylase UbiE